MLMKLKLKPIDLIGMIMFIPLCKPSSVEYLFPMLDKFLDVGKILVFVVTVIIFVAKKIPIERFLLLLVLIQSINGIATLFNPDGNLRYWVVSSATLLVIYLYYRIFLVYYKVNINAMLFVPKTLVYLNIVCFFLWPQGMYTSYDGTGGWYSDLNWLLGMKNSYFMFFLPMLILSIREDIDEHGNIILSFWNICLFVACCFNMFFISRSASGIVGMMLLLSYFVIKNTQIIHAPRCIVFYSVTAIVITIFLLIFWENNILIRLIASLMSKSTTLTGRTAIWQKSIGEIGRNLWIGHGMENNVTLVLKLGQTSTHNKYLQTLYQGGVTSGLVSVILIGIILKKLYRNYDKPVIQFLSWTIFVQFVLWEVESFDKSKDVMAILFFCYFSATIFLNQLPVTNNTAITKRKDVK